MLGKAADNLDQRRAFAMESAARQQERSLHYQAKLQNQANHFKTMENAYRSLFDAEDIRIHFGDAEFIEVEHLPSGYSRRVESHRFDQLADTIREEFSKIGK